MAVISIIVPVYNIEKYLCQCLDSLICQTFTDIEIILVDDGSTDGCYGICENYMKIDSRIVVIHKENEGLVNARKTGIDHAHGDYIAYVDGDDWIEPDMYERMYHKITEETVDVVMCGRYEDTGETSKAVFHGLPEGRYDKLALMEKVYPRLIVNDAFFEWGVFPGVWDKLFKRELVERFQKAVDDRIAMGEDAACVYPCLLNADSIYIMHECLYHYRQTTSSMVKQIKNYVVERRQFKVLYQTVNISLRQYSQVYDLRQQWRKYVLFLMVPRADGLYQGYENLDYLFPFPRVRKGFRIVLYGAGTYGQRLYGYLQKTEFCNVTAWLDRNYTEFQKMGLNVQAPSILPDLEYDAILVANTYEKSRKRLYQELIKKYPKEKVHIIDEELIFSRETACAFGLQNN
ncbi:glycosyltransferase family 2 protein [Lacrimispora sp.]|uniref:glycosyltransferase family 2 protein n=1 Tax=Lacrimispora sp. TaxID=2719234 RepID=UPI00289EF723|nr:glycosyltransferase family 2 protein [Lacrimispora sp.]